MFTYMNDQVRRQDRLLDEEKGIRLLEDGEYGVLSLAREGEAYGIPLNYARRNNVLYFHCATEGKKLDWIVDNSRASFCVVGYTQVQPDKFSTLYESIILSGWVDPVSDDVERMTALELLIEKYSPGFKNTGRKYAMTSFHKTTILRFTIEQMSGKSKSVMPSR